MSDPVALPVPAPRDDAEPVQIPEYKAPEIIVVQPVEKIGEEIE